MAEQAVRAFLADHLAGKSTILTAYEHADRDELNRRAQEYLREWGQLDTSASASLAEGRAAHPGDLIRATENNNRILAGVAGQDAGQRRHHARGEHRRPRQ